MAGILDGLLVQYKQYEDQYKDPRVEEWPLMDSPKTTFVLCAAYVIFVKAVGPSLMQNRKPYDLKWLMMVYNVVVVLINAGIFWTAGYNYFSGEFSITCQPVKRGFTEKLIRDAFTCYVFYLSKILDFVDTIFIVLKKKPVSHLHLLHHATLPLHSWFGVKFAPGGHTMFSGMLNSFVHVLMYSYYFLAALGPSVRPFLWWKKYLTSIQLIQFVVLFWHSFQLFFIECDYPRFLLYYMAFMSVVFFSMFLNFYVKSYTQAGEKKRR